MRTDMANTMTMEKTIGILGAMVAAINNIRLYPPGSGLISNSVDKAFSAIQTVITENEPLLIAEAEGNLMISGEPVGYRMQQYPQIATFRGCMTTLGIRSILLKKSMTTQEFRSFLTILSRTSEESEAEGGLQKMTAKAALKHIAITPALFAGGARPAKVKPVDFPDLDLIKAFTGERTARETDYMRIGEKASDSRWVAEFFKAAVIQLQNQGVTMADSLYSDSISRMVRAFARSTPRENWGRVSGSSSRAIGQAEKKLLAVVMVKNVDEQLFDIMIASLSDEEYVDFIAEIDLIREEHAFGGKPLKDDELEKVAKTLDTLKKHQKTDRLKKSITQKIIERKREVAKTRAHLVQGLAKMMKGDLAPLADPGILESIPDAVKRYYSEGKDRSAVRLIEKIADGLLNDSVKERALSSSALMAISAMLMEEGNDKGLRMIVDRLNIWVKFESEATFNFKAVCQLLQTYTQNLLGQHRFSEANALLETFSFIHDGKISKNNEIRDIADSVLRSIASDKIFKIVFDEFIENSKGKGKDAYYTLIRLGKISVPPLLDLLRQSEDMSQRIRVINTLTEIGPAALPFVIERIQAGCPWFYMRNLIKLLSDMGNPDHLDILRPLLTHDNEKIPKQALNCAFDIGGDQRLKFFTQALKIENHDVKKAAVDLIGKLETEDGVFPLCQLLKSGATSPADLKNELDLTICTALKRIGSKKAIPSLKLIETQKGILGISVYSPELRQAAAATVKHLQELPAKIAPPPERKKIFKAETSATEGLLTEDPARLEALVDEYVKRKNIQEAVNLLYKMTIRFAREKNFTKAEELREKLFAVDPMALAEIVKTGDVIEEEKKNAVLSDYMAIWANLNDMLTADEANDLFYSVKPMTFPADHTLVAQQQRNSNLYFINRGQIKIVYAQGDKETFIKMLGSGDVAGDDTFFSISVSTVSLVTMSQVKVGCLKRETLKGLEEKHPGIEDKLRRFCVLGGDINDLVTRKGLERRQQTRVSLAGKTMVQLLDLKSTPIGKPFKGTILDISTGGIAFSIRTSNWQTTRLLLGRKLQMTIMIKTATAPIELSGMGTIIGARERKNGRFSLHLKFDNPIMESKMIEIVSQSVSA